VVREQRDEVTSRIAHEFDAVACEPLLNERWVTLTPDGKTAYVANPVTNDVLVVGHRLDEGDDADSGWLRSKAEGHRFASIALDGSAVLV
jgi:hypothetical protein